MAYIRTAIEIDISEKSLAKILVSYFSRPNSRWKAFVPNCYTLSENECDLFGVRKSLLTDEFEIKISRQDFLQDKLKEVRFNYGKWYNKHDAYTRGMMPTNYFWYVTFDGICNKEDIPDFAGWIEISKYGMIRIHKEAPKTNKTKMSEKDIIHHLMKLSKKFWNQD